MRHSDPSASFLLNIVVNTGRVGQVQTGIARMRQRIVLRQAWVGDRRTISRGQGRENNPRAKAESEHRETD